MDPITFILAALSAGAVASAKDVASEAVKDAYHGLRDVLKKRFAGRPEAEVALDQHADAAGAGAGPNAWEPPLREALEKIGAATDQEVLAAATLLRDASSADGTTTTVVVRGATVKFGAASKITATEIGSTTVQL